MKKLLLLDADIVIDLHSNGLFNRICQSYDVYITREVIKEAKYYKKGKYRLPINITKTVTIVSDIDINHLREVRKEAQEARLLVDPGESESIAYLIQNRGCIFCTCDTAAIKLISYIDIDDRAISLEKALKDIGQNVRLLPRHLEKQFKKNIKDGKALRVQFKF
jgi:hypothetical protein